MKYRNLGRSGLKVSEITMGTFTFGGRGPFKMVGEQGVTEARRLVDCCIDHGVNLFDCANMYSVDLAEEILGEVLEGRPDVHVTSKVRMPIGARPNDGGASRYHILRECERSLKRLRRDHIDIYYLHEWDGSAPLDEALAVSDARGLARFATQQIHYTLKGREAEHELLPIAVDQGLGTLLRRASLTP